MRSELPQGYLLRRPEPPDAEGIVAVMIACDVADTGEPDSTLEDLTADWALPRFDRRRDAWIVAAPDRSTVAYAWVWDRVPHTDLQGDVHVHPGHRGRGIESVLIRLLEERGLEHVPAAPAGAEVSLAIFAGPGCGRASILSGMGYAQTRTFLRMTIHLKAGYPAPITPEGIEIRPFQRGRDERTLQETIDESFADHFRFARETHEDWVSRRMGHPEFDPELWLVAWDGAECAGAALAYPFGDLGWVRELGVRPRWRGRGIGKALLLETFRAFERRGRDRVSLGVDAANESGATRLYEAVGMREEQRHDLYQKSLGSSR